MTVEALIDDIEWFRGDSYPAEILVQNKITEAAVDLTGYSFKLTVDSKLNPPDASTKLFEVTGDLDADPTSGRVSFTPTPEQTNLTPKTYYYDIQMTDPAGHIRTIAKYKWVIVQDISK